jgi:hypothetical protein
VIRGNKNSKGSGLVVALIVIVLLGGIGILAYSKGYLNPNMMSQKSNDPNSYALNPISSMSPTIADSPEATPLAGGLVTSNLISLNIQTPLNGANLTNGKVTLKGKTSANAEVFVNDQSTKADANGNFSLPLTLDEGLNNLVVTANDAEGNVAEQDLSVNVQTF